MYLLLSVYECHSVSQVIQSLGYPKTRQGMYLWIKQRNTPPKKKTVRRKINNPPEHPLHPSFETKLSIIRRCFIEGENIQLVSEETGYSRASIYTWRRKYQSKGTIALMDTQNDPKGVLHEATPSSAADIDALRQQIQEMQLEIDILKETINVLKKDPSVNIEALKNREKAVIVDALIKQYSLPQLLNRLGLSKSSYYYQKSLMIRPDKYTDIRTRVITIFYDSRGRYGYRRIHGMLQRECVHISEKVVRRSMQEENLLVKTKRRRMYSSYKGEISPDVPNIVQRNFHAEQPNRK